MADKAIYIANELFKKICAREPIQSEISLFDNLKVSLNPLKQTSVSTSTKYRYFICQNNYNSEEFENIYQQLHKANSKELDSLVCLLHSIKKSPEITEMLSQTCLPNVSYPYNQSNTPIDLVKSSSKISTSRASNKTEVPSLMHFLSDSTFITMDFINNSSLIQSRETIPPISSLDIPSQENALIKDLIYCLMGDHGTYIKALPLMTSERQFDIDASMYPGFLDLVKSVLEIANQLSTVHRFVDEYRNYNYGNVNQTLASAINLQIKDFRLLVCQMEELFYRGNLTLTGMLNCIKESGILIRCMASICTDILKCKSRGGAVLSMFFHHSLTAGNQKQSSLINHLMKSCTVPFFRMLRIWLYRGIISDPHQEFFIRDNGGHTNESNINQAYWTNKYTIVDNLVPRFLEMHVEKILLTGKYLNVIQLCDGDTAFPDVEDIAYETEEQHFVLQIDRAYQYASKLLLNKMFNDKKLKEHLMLMKHFFLLDQADWLSHFMNSANDELNDKISECQKSRIESLLEVAIQASGTIHDPLKENISVELSNQELIPFIYRIMNYDPCKRVTSQNVVGQNLRVLEAFSLNIATEWPISLVLNHSVVQRYQILFRHLFYCHHVERVLFGVWSTNKGRRAQSNDNWYLNNKASILGNNMRTFIQHLIYYMTTEVIEPSWNDFWTKLNQAQNLDEVLKFHEDFLQSCVINCIGPVDMLKCLQKMMVLCINYANRLNRLRSSSRDKDSDGVDTFNRQAVVEDIGHMYDTESLEKIINQDEATFTSIAKNLINTIRSESNNKMLLKLVVRLEFNGFYDECSNNSDVDS